MSFSDVSWKLFLIDFFDLESKALPKIRNNGKTWTDIWEFSEREDYWTLTLVKSNCRSFLSVGRDKSASKDGRYKTYLRRWLKHIIKQKKNKKFGKIYEDAKGWKCTICEKLHQIMIDKDTYHVLLCKIKMKMIWRLSWRDPVHVMFFKAIWIR